MRCRLTATTTGIRAVLVHDKFEFESETATGLAVVNLSPFFRTTITLTELDSSGATVGMGGTLCDDFDTITKGCSFLLGPGEHRSFFLSEAITVPEDMVVGTVFLESTSILKGTFGTDITAIAVKFDSNSHHDKKRRYEFTVSPVTQLAP